METADWAVMEGGQDELLAPAVIRQALREAADSIIAPPADAASRLTAAIGADGDLQSLSAERKNQELRPSGA